MRPISRNQVLKRVQFGKLYADREGAIAEGVTHRVYENSSTYAAVGTSYCYIKCPFCGDRVKTYIWSISGGGKRCDCGALFDSRGNAFHLTEYAKLKGWIAPEVPNHGTRT